MSLSSALPLRRSGSDLFIRWVSSLVIALGILVLLGWTFGIEEFKSVIPGWVSMKPNTAIGFLLSGLALRFFAQPTESLPSSPCRWFLLGCVILLAIIGFGTCLQYSAGWDLGIDTLFFEEEPDAPYTLSPGRMALGTAVCFSILAVVFGMRLLSISIRPGSAVFGGLGATVVAIATLSFTEYLGELAFGIRQFDLSAMAIHTSIAFVLIGICLVVFEVRENSLGWAIGFKLTLIFVTGLLVLLALNSFMQHSASKVLYAGKKAAHAQKIRYYASSLESSVIQLESAQRGFVITEKEDFYQEFTLSGEAARSSLLILLELAAEDPVQLGRLQRIQPLVEARIAFSEQLVQVVLNQGFEAAAELIRSGEGVRLTGLIRDLIQLINEQESEFARARETEAVATKDLAFHILPFGTFISICLLVSVVFVLNREMGERIAAEAIANEKVKEASDLRSALNEHAIVAVTDRRGRILSVNDKFCAISKYSREEVLGQDHRLINSGFHSKAFFKDLWETIKAGIPWHGEIRNRTKDGAFYWVDTTIVPILDKNGSPHQFIAIRADITERKRAEQALRESEDLFRSAFTNAAIGVAICRADGRYIEANEAFCKVTGYSNEELGALVLGRFLHPEDRRESELLLQAIREGRMPGYVVRCRYVRKNGELVHVQKSVSLVRDWEGRPLRIIALVEDISERVRSEEKIQQLNIELENRVKKRTAELELANKELEAFSYSVSHDLRAPLRAVDGFAKIVVEDYGALLPKEGLQTLERVRRGAQQMALLIDDLLAFARLNRAPLNKRVVKTNELVAGVLDELNVRNVAEKLDLRVADLPDCLGDAALLRQVWINLISNAVKYSRNRVPAIIEIGYQEGKEICFYVKDNGTGFDMKYAHKLFGVFQRLHRVEEFEGTGVGLAIVQRVIHRHNGRVWSLAAPDQGAAFFFTLPN